jgi:hypothetical protein
MTANAGEDAGNPYILLVGIEISATTTERSMNVPQKTKNRTTSDTTPGHIPKRM